MSNIYIQEPPTSGKVLLKTTVGDIDLELWSKEAPKACRNFIQLCLEGYYNGTLFHRVVKGFIVQGGDPTGTGTGGESIYGQPFKDEFHSRLRFNRRGLLAMANAGKNDNGSQFFFTLGATPELQNKHTIFGKVTGETLFNMLKLEDALVDRDERPVYPQKIVKTEVLSNPFTDIEPRCVPKDEEVKEERKKKKDKGSGVKNFKLLSFGEEAEEDEEETIEANKKYSGRSKSTHDLLDDPSLSAVTAVDGSGSSKEGDEGKDDPDLSGDEDRHVAHEKDEEEMNRIRKKLKRKLDQEAETSRGKTAVVVAQEEEEAEEYEFGKERREQKLREAENIRKEIRDLKRGLQDAKRKKEEEEQEKESNVKEKENNEGIVKEYLEEQEKYKVIKNQVPKKGVSRESFTLAMLAKFQKKLATAREQIQENSDDESQKPDVTPDDDDNDNNEGWLTHRLRFEENAPVLAKDASTKNDDWFEIFDPRNPINKRRREASKQALKSRDRK